MICAEPSADYEKNNVSICHLLYMPDIKLYARSDIDTQIHPEKKPSQW